MKMEMLDKWKEKNVGLTKKGFVLILSIAIIMVCQQNNSEEFMVVAHRGASRAAPENTLAALKKAIEYGADYAECDVFQTKDGELVLFHDEEMERTTGKEGMIWEYTLAELKNAEAGAWFKEEYKGEPIPTLREAMHLARGKIKLDIEVKVSGRDPEIAAQVVDIIRSENFEKACMVTSFEKSVIEKVKQIAPELITGLIFDEEHPPGIFEGDWEYVCSNRTIVDDAFMQKAKQNGKKVFVWTVNYPGEMERLIELGVDGIITDVPEILREVLFSIKE
jgi:glycerophosphoryl diester phosphodiesterase